MPSRYGSVTGRVRVNSDPVTHLVVVFLKLITARDPDISGACQANVVPVSLSDLKSYDCAWLVVVTRPVMLNTGLVEKRFSLPPAYASRYPSQRSRTKTS